MTWHDFLDYCDEKVRELICEDWDSAGIRMRVMLRVLTFPLINNEKSVMQEKRKRRVERVKNESSREGMWRQKGKE